MVRFSWVGGMGCLLAPYGGRQHIRAVDYLRHIWVPLRDLELVLYWIIVVGAEDRSAINVKLCLLLRNSLLRMPWKYQV